MYNLVSSLGLKRTVGAQWTEVDLADTLVYQIFNEYNKVILTLTNPYLDGQIYVDLDVLKDSFAAYGGTLSQMLVEIANRSLPTIKSLPNAKVSYAVFSDAFRAGYKVETTIVGRTTPKNYIPSDLVDLKLTRPNFETDMRLIHSHCLVTVNGFIHNTDTDGTAAYVYAGRKSLTKSRENQIGLISFMDIGALKKISIQPTDIYSQDNDSRLKTRTYFHVEEDLTNKSVMLVLGGYLVLPEPGVFWQTGERTFAINFSSLPMLERYFESSQYLDLSSLELSVSTDNPDMINAEEFFSDDVLKRYMTLSQSFLVVVDAPLLFTAKHYLKHCNMPGMFTAYKEPKQTLMVGYGRVAEYWKTEEDSHWSVTVQDAFLRNFAFSYRPTKQLQNVTAAAVPTRTFKHSQGFLLDIGTYK